MSVQAISNKTSFTGKTIKTEKGNTYTKSRVAETIGLMSGTVIASGLVVNRMNNLKTFAGKRDLLEGFASVGKTLNDIMPKVKGVNRAKAIAKQYRSTLLLYGAGIIALAGITGKIIDNCINKKRAQKADLK